MEAKTQIRTAGVLTLLAGAWLLLAPLFISVTAGALISQMVVGGILVLAAIVQEFIPETSLTGWVSGLAGLWMVLSPIFLSVSTGAAWSQVVVGAVAMVVAAWDGFEVNLLARVHA